MDLIAAMLAGMGQEMAVDHEAQAQRACEQAQRADDQVCHLEDVLQSSIASLKAKRQQYTNQACDIVRNELLDKVQTLEGEVQGLREEVRTEKQRHELAAVRAKEQAAPRVLAGTTGVADLLGPAWGHWQEPSARGPRSIVSEPAEVYRACLKKRTREWGETLSQLAQDVEVLVRRSYPMAPEEMIVVLGRDSFIDALDDQQVQIYVKQAHPGDLQVALVAVQAMKETYDRRMRNVREDEDESPSSSNEDVVGLPKTGMSVEQVARLVTGDLDPELGARDAPLGGAADSPQPMPLSPQRPRRQRRRPGWTRDFCDVLED
ncbi:hypothetical protein O3P69_020876 [Scylla paramamosain]|uniref:Uncharacterized protein n=1 Tax=Scylla paramamosain TaxID=85552 RepID=A0AAW0TNE9_SCYPA